MGYTLLYLVDIGGFIMQNYPYNLYQNMQPSYYSNALQHQQTAAQNINTVIPVSNKEEAVATPVDLVNGTPTFFYNKGKNEIYIKQFDVQSGSATIKTFIQSEHDSKPDNEGKNNFDINAYKKDMDYLKSGIDSLHKMFAENILEEEETEEYTKPKRKGTK